MSNPKPDDIARLAELLGRASSIVAFTGAGISTESGIPDYRSPGGQWTKKEPIYFDDFRSSEDARLEDWNRRFEMRDLLEEAEPNAGHLALVELAKRGVLKAVVTQNIDGMHQRAGLARDSVIELHGNATYGMCLDCRCEMSLDDVEKIIRETGRAPRCETCGGLIKAAVISFGQSLDHDTLNRAVYAIESADLCLVLGTSLVVEPAASLPRFAVERGAKLAIVNLQSTPLDRLSDYVTQKAVGEVLPRAIVNMRHVSV